MSKKNFIFSFITRKVHPSFSNGDLFCAKSVGFDDGNDDGCDGCDVGCDVGIDNG